MLQLCVMCTLSEATSRYVQRINDKTNVSIYRLLSPAGLVCLYCFYASLSLAVTLTVYRWPSGFRTSLSGVGYC